MRGDNIQNGCANEPENNEASGLAHIDFKGSNPFELFKDWLSEARASHLINPDALCLSTSNKDGKPSSRHVLLRRLDDDGIVIMTDGRSRKSNELKEPFIRFIQLKAKLAENPHASIAYLWSYMKDGKKINRQVRLEGRVEEVAQSACQDIWEREPLFCKIRAHICDQGVPTDWQEHKDKHDRMYQDILAGKEVPQMPSHVAFYKVIPSFIEFYYAFDNYIGDRLAFHGVDQDSKAWKLERIMA